MQAENNSVQSPQMESAERINRLIDEIFDRLNKISELAGKQ